jgi:ABC-2 type transport system permease protein
VSTLAGARTLIRFAARRERVRVPVYLFLMAATVASTVGQSESLYATQAERADYARTVEGNPGLIALVGRAYDLMTPGGDTAWQLGGIGAITAGLMSMFILGRHTRGEEQTGRSELVRASAVGRRAPIAAGLFVVVVVNVMLAVVVALSMLAAGEPAAGSWALGASLGGAGLFFAGVAAVALQVNQSTGGAYGLVGAVLGGSYLLRAAGDVGDGTLSWLSPVGWAQAMRPFADERWWPLLLLLAGAGILTAAALALLERRDDGAGLVAPRPGPARASGALVLPVGLAARLLRGALIGWAVGLFLAGVSVGLVGQDVEGLLGDSGEVDKLYGQTTGSLADNYLAVSLSSMALIGTAFALQAMLRMRAEETGGRAESLLATALARPRWAAAHLAVAAGGSLLILAALGLGAGIADAISSDDAGRLPVLFGSALALAPAVWVLAGAALALFGLVPRAATAAWGLLGGCFLLLYLGPLLSLPDWVMDISPYTHVPLLPAEDVSVAPLLALTAVAMLLAAAGVLGLRRRDIPVA